MISCEFAPNEEWSDVWISLKTILKPWKWNIGCNLEQAKKKLLLVFGFDSKYFNIVFFFTGRSALYTILSTLNLPNGSEVVVQAFTCEAVILPILEAKLSPVYVDIEESSLSMDPVVLERNITKKTKVVILQHTFGIPPIHREKILLLIKKHNLVLIEDIAHGYSKLSSSPIEPRINNQKLKSIYLMSFGRSKAISSVFGGAIVTNNSNLSQKLLKAQLEKRFPSRLSILRLLLYKPLAMIIKSTYDYGFGKLLHKILYFLSVIVPEISQKEKNGSFDKMYDKAYPNALATLLFHQLNKFEQIQSHRALICSEYIKYYPNQKFSYQNIPMIRFPLLVKQPPEILFKASQQNIFLGKWYDQVVAPKGLDLRKIRYKQGSCPVSENICQHIINLPTLINIKNIQKIINVINLQSKV